MSADKVIRVTDDERKAIFKHYGKSEKDIVQYIHILREWLKKQPHLPHDADDAILINMICLNKFDIEKTKSKLDLSYTFRTIIPEFCDDREPLLPCMQKIMNVGILVPLPHLTNGYKRVWLAKLTNSDPNELDVEAFFKLVFTIGDLRLKYDICIADQYIFDFDLVQWEHILKAKPTLIRKAFTIMQKAYSDIIDSVHFINLPTYANVLITLVKSLLTTKMGNRVIIHNNVESLHKYFPTHMLPSDYGGTEKSMIELGVEWRKFLESNNDYIKEIQTKKSNESLRQTKVDFTDYFGGIQGSFRQLSID